MFWFWIVWNDGWFGGKIKLRISLPCVVHHGVIFCPLYAKNHLVVFRIYKLKQGAGRRIYLHSATISLWNTCTYSMPSFLYDAQKCSFICFTPLTGLPTETVPTKKKKKLLSPSPKWLLGFNLWIPLKFIPWQSSGNVAERERNCWNAECLKQKINKSLMWFKWDSPDAGHHTKLYLLLLCL